MIVKKLYILSCLLIFSLSFAQELKGKWAMIIDSDTYSIPPCPIFEFKNQELIIYDFEDTKGKIPIEIHEKSEYFIENNNKKVGYKITKSHFLSIINTDQKSKITNDYVRLLPTKLDYPIEKVLNKRYALEIKDKEEVFSFINDTDYNVKIEKIDATYFITIHFNNKRERFLPIKEINKDYLLVYGVPGIQSFIKAKAL